MKNVIEFVSMESPEFVFQQTMETLQALHIRHDIAERLAAYAAFNNEEFDPQSRYLVQMREEMGLEPEIMGRAAA